MECPLCKKHTMNPISLLPDLSALVCSECAGLWIARTNYDAWRAKQPGDLPETTTPIQVTVTQVHKPKICPQCNHLLLPYRVGHGLPFSIDYCGACGGVWCDHSEWDALKAKNLHDNLLDIISDHWQAALRQTDVQDAVEQTYKKQLGAAYAKAVEMRTWLQDQPKKSLILAYLSNLKIVPK